MNTKKTQKKTLTIFLYINGELLGVNKSLYLTYIFL
jgi:hypothetical protein